MLGLTQPRISQLVKSGELIAEKDAEGRLRFDRIAAERLAQFRALRGAKNNDEREERKALQAEARDRFARARKHEREEKERRQREQDSLYERAVNALERIARCRTPQD